MNRNTTAMYLEVHRSTVNRNTTAMYVEVQHGTDAEEQHSDVTGYNIQYLT